MAAPSCKGGWEAEMSVQQEAARKTGVGNGHKFQTKGLLQVGTVTVLPTPPPLPEMRKIKETGKEQM